MTVRLSLLGSFQLSRDGDSIQVAHAGQRVVAYLALSSHGWVPRERVACELWPDRCRQRSLANLRSALWRLPPSVRDCIAESNHGLSLRADVSVDIDLLDLTDGLSVPAEVASSPLLPGWYDEWLVSDRERIELRRLAILEQIAMSRLGQRRYSEAIDLALLAIASEPFRESLHRIVIRGHIEEGNLSEARAHFERLRSLLAKELGVGPSPTTAALIEDHAMTAPRR